MRAAGGRRSIPPAEQPADLGDRAADPDADPEVVARAICLRLLAARARTRAELGEALAARAVPDAASTKVLDRLAEVGLVNDAAFAAGYVSSRQRDRGLAVREISRQLRDKGVDEVVITAAVGDIDPNMEADVARRLVLRKLRSMSGLADEVKMRRLTGMLARKGYSPSVAFRIVREVLGSEAGTAVADDTAWLA